VSIMGVEEESSALVTLTTRWLVLRAVWAGSAVNPTDYRYVFILSF
jgi:hypothetical protein